MKTHVSHSLHDRLFKAPLRLALTVLLMGLFSTAAAQDFVWAPDFEVGATIPEISAQDQDGNLQTFADLVGEKGMLFMLSRSFDW